MSNKLLFLLCLAIMICNACTKVEERTLAYNFLHDSPAGPVLIDTVIITQSSPAFKSLRIEFTPLLDSLTAEQRKLVTGFVVHENGVMSSKPGLDQRYFIKLDQPKNRVLKWQIALNGVGGESRKSAEFVYVVP